jgi:hypothetical protein
MRNLGLGLVSKLKRGTSEGRKMAYLNLRPRDSQHASSGLLKLAELAGPVKLDFVSHDNQIQLVELCRCPDDPQVHKRAKVE